MARPKSLATLSIDALIKLRDDVADTLSSQVQAMQEQLARFTGSDGSRPKIGKRTKAPKAKVSKLKGRKAPVKYRDKEGNKWSGRGAQPRWMTAAIKAGAKRDDFLVGKPGRPAKAKKPAKAKPAKKAAKKRKPAKVAKKPAKKRVAKVVASAPAPSPQA
jgi:DNA-binding protein H-NS